MNINWCIFTIYQPMYIPFRYISPYQSHLPESTHGLGVRYSGATKICQR